MKLIFSENAWDDCLYWQQNDKTILKKINALIHDINRDPFSEKGKPEPLKYKLTGYWSRRINIEHRVVYKTGESSIYIAACRYHY